ncbi:MAG TPA: hypothetical protein VEU47_19020 [Candidatus Cybelea sp.]|nr:hypothetical protein [Candidatus Cybelea sp.]
MKRWLPVGIAVFVGALASLAAAQKTTPDAVNGCVFNNTPPTLSDKQNVPFQCDTNGQLKISGNINATSTVKATAAAPNYVEGSTDPFSSDLSGNIRTLATVNIPANQTVNVNQIAGTGTATGNGATNAGTQRVTISNDSTGTVAVTQSTNPWTDNISQWNGNTVDTNSGNKSAGTLRVVLATDQPNLSSALNVNCTSGCSSGTSTNNGDAIATGATAGNNDDWLYGFNGTSWDRLRVNSAKDLNVNLNNTTISMGVTQGTTPWAVGGTGTNNGDALATGATAQNVDAWLYGFNGTSFDRLRLNTNKALNVSLTDPLTSGTNTIGNVGQQVEMTSGSLSPVIGCNSTASFDNSTSGDTRIITGATGQTVRVCGYTIFADATVNVQLDSGIGATCATAKSHMTPAYQLVAQTGIVNESPFWNGLAANNGADVCVSLSTTATAQVLVKYVQF